MPTPDVSLEKIRHSPQLPRLVNDLQQTLRDENERRQQFYADITPEQKAEFIDGQVIMHSPARSAHLQVTLNITTLMRTFVGVHGKGIVNSEKCLCSFARNDYEPDVVYFGPQKASSIDDNTLQFPIPDLIVEVLSPSTEKADRGVKLEDYHASGVGEYWIVDADQKVIEQYLPGEHEFDLAMKSSSGVLRSQVLEGFEIEIQACFDNDSNLAALRQLLN